jgi:hypothetical protein
MNTKETGKVSKLRIAAGVGLGAIGLSIAASLVPAVANADPYVPYRKPTANSAPLPG